MLRALMTLVIMAAVLGGTGCFGSTHQVIPGVSEPAPISVGADLPDAPGEIDRDFTWSYEGEEWEWSIPIPRSLHQYYSERPRIPTENYSIYASDPLDDAFMERLGNRFDAAAQQHGYDEFDTVNLAVAFVQDLPYAADVVTTTFDEYPRYPIETLVDGGGDCEDTSILLAAILHAMGYDVVLLRPANHMAVGVLGGKGIHGTYFEHDGGKYFYLETTGRGWEIGQMPEEYEGQPVSIFTLDPTPILSHRWSAKTYETDAVVEVTVSNLGTAPARGVYVYAGFDAGGERLWNAERSQRFDLEPGYYVDVTLSLDLPEGKETTRLVVQTVYMGYAYDESRSEWFDL